MKHQHAVRSGEQETFTLHVIRLAAPAMHAFVETAECFVLGPVSALIQRPFQRIALLDAVDYIVSHATCIMLANIGLSESLQRDVLSCRNTGVRPLLFIGIDQRIRLYPVTPRLLSGLARGLSNAT